MKTGVGVGRKCFRVGVSLREVDTISKTQEVGFPRVMKITAHRCVLLSLSFLHARTYLALARVW